MSLIAALRKAIAVTKIAICITTTCLNERCTTKQERPSKQAQPTEQADKRRPTRQHRVEQTSKPGEEC
eukprot:1508442-Amphidinium_carterae.1